MTGETHAGEQAALPPAIEVAGASLPVWPDGQKTEALSAPLAALTVFADWESYHPALIEATLAAEKDQRLRDAIFRGGCGVKVRKIPEWNAAAAALIHARALMLAHRTLSRRAVFADDTWASVYRAGDYCMPHSHLRSNVSIVYMLDPGDGDPEDRMAGRFCFADPRIDACCPDEPGRVTQHLMPNLAPGTMLIFASDYLHSVNPYQGRRPRITLSWNITLERLSGRAGEGWNA
ncbi:MAG TPA: putative 2OG-Fe(II) oxygenase [Casimicrobiaceae bacterium]|nr:putative 2OG-Fe(II) oxygenase [Casimicrobiaceae bacterium]